jgi:hypothetical protein
MRFRRIRRVRAARDHPANARDRDEDVGGGLLCALKPAAGLF